MKTEIVYAVGTPRVSSGKQGLQGDSLEDQERQIKARAEQLSSIIGKKIFIKKWFKFTESASGEIDEQPVNEAIDYCLEPRNKIKYFFFKSVDRMTRAGAVIYGQLKMKLTDADIRCVDVYGVVGYQQVNTLAHLGVSYPWSKFNPSWTAEILAAENSKGEVRDILTRMIGAEINYVRLGYRVRSAPPGYKNVKIETSHGTRVILAPHEIEAPWFIKMFELRIQGNLTDEKIVDEVNKTGYKSRRIKKHDPRDITKIIGLGGEHPLNVKQLQKYVQNPIYAGVNTEKWTNGQPIKAKFDGLVTIDMFNKANMNKINIVEEGDTVKIFKGKPPLWQLRKQKENPVYPYKQYVLCPICRKQVLGSASRSKSGKHIPRYHCARNHKYWSVNSEKFHGTIKKFVENVKFSEKFVNGFRRIVLEEWKKRRERVQDDSITAEKRVLVLKGKQKVLLDKIKLLSSPVAIRAVELEADELENEIVQARQVRDRHENTELEITTLINYSNYYMEHLEELLLGSPNPLTNAALFGLIFNQSPTYDEIVNGTLDLSPIVELNEEYKKSKSLSVNSLFP